MADDLTNALSNLRIRTPRSKIEEDRQIRPILILSVKELSGDFRSLAIDEIDFCKYLGDLERAIQKQFGIDKFAIETSVGQWSRSRALVLKGHIPVAHYLRSSQEVQESDRDVSELERIMHKYAAFHDMSLMMDDVEDWEELAEGYLAPQMIDGDGICEHFHPLIVAKESCSSLEECHARLLEICRDLGEMSFGIFVRKTPKGRVCGARLDIGDFLKFHREHYDGDFKPEDVEEQELLRKYDLSSDQRHYYKERQEGSTRGRGRGRGDRGRGRGDRARGRGDRARERGNNNNPFSGSR